MASIGVVVLDTLRKDYFDEYFDWLPGVRYENAWAPSHWTVPVHASIFTGHYPTEHGVTAKNISLNSSTEVLPEKLSKAGYMTRAFSANPSISPPFGFDKGFDHFSGSARVRPLMDDVYSWADFFERHHSTGPQRYLYALRGCLFEDCDTMASIKYGIQMMAQNRNLWSPHDSGAREALNWVNEQTFDDDEFVFLNLMEAHAPYDEIPDSAISDRSYTPPQEIGLQQVFENPDRSKVKQSYENAVQYLAAIYRKIFEELQSELDYIITLADHGELLGEHGLWGHEYSLYPEVTHVPLVISNGRNQSSSRDDAVSLLDVHQTIADIADLDVFSEGQNLLTENEGQSYLLEGHGLPKRRIRKLNEQRYDIEKYDTTLRGIVTPTDGFGHYTAEGWISEGEGDLREQLERKANQLTEGKGERPDIDEDTLAQLRDMGYA